MRLKCVRKQLQCDVCDKMFNNYSVMVVHKRIHFGERPYKCLDCGIRFSCTSSLKSHYNLHKEQNVYDYENADFATNLSSYKKGEVNAEHKNHELDGFEQTYFCKYLLNQSKFVFTIETEFKLFFKT